MPARLLPSTGGMGTTVFYVLGAVLVVGAGVLLVTKKRMSQGEDLSGALPLIPFF